MESLEIITLVTGVIYVILEVLQKNSMWVLGVVTSLGTMGVYGTIFVRSMMPDASAPGDGLPMFLLYLYYTVISVYGLYQWKTFKGSAKDSAAPEKDVLVMKHLSKKEVTLGLALLVAGMVLVPQFLQEIGLWTEKLSSWLSVLNVVLSAIGTYWLTKAYIEQWYVWILANAVWTVYNMMEGLWWMSALSAVYIVSAVFGLVHWRRHGQYID